MLLEVSLVDSQSDVDYIEDAAGKLRRIDRLNFSDSGVQRQQVTNY